MKASRPPNTAIMVQLALAGDFLVALASSSRKV